MIIFDQNVQERHLLVDVTNESDVRMMSVGNIEHLIHHVQWDVACEEDVIDVSMKGTDDHEIRSLAQSNVPPVDFIEHCRSTKQMLFPFPHEDVGERESERRSHGTADDLTIEFLLVAEHVLFEDDASEFANGIDGNVFHLVIAVLKKKFGHHVDGLFLWQHRVEIGDVERAQVRRWLKLTACRVQFETSNQVSAIDDRR